MNATATMFIPELGMIEPRPCHEHFPMKPQLRELGVPNHPRSQRHVRSRVQPRSARHAIRYSTEASARLVRPTVEMRTWRTSPMDGTQPSRCWRSLHRGPQPLSRTASQIADAISPTLISLARYTHVSSA